MSYGLAQRNDKARPKASSTPFLGLPIWSGFSIILAALITGSLIGYWYGALGTSYTVCFVVATLVVTLFVEARGLWLIIAGIPLLFGIVTSLAAAIISGSFSSSEGLSITQVVAAIYPVILFFPTLLTVTLIAFFIAVGRIYLLRRQAKHMHNVVVSSRRSQRLEARSNVETVTKARNQSARVRTRRSLGESPTPEKQVTVDELIERSRQRRQRLARGEGLGPETTFKTSKPSKPSKPRSERPSRSFFTDDDLYK